MRAICSVAARAIWITQRRVVYIQSASEVSALTNLESWTAGGVHFGSAVFKRNQIVLRLVVCVTFCWWWGIRYRPGSLVKGLMV
jgi:hypothetical protein